MGGTGNTGLEPEGQKSALVGGGPAGTPGWAGGAQAPGMPSLMSLNAPAENQPAVARDYELTTGSTGAGATAQPTQNLGFPTDPLGFKHQPYPTHADVPTYAGAAAPAATAPAADAAAKPDTSGQDWVYAYLPNSVLSTNALLKGGQSQIAGISTPKDLNMWSVYGHLDPAYGGGKPEIPPGFGTMPPGSFKPGDKLDEATAALYPRMRRSLYDFNMANYGNYWGAGGNAPLGGSTKFPPYAPSPFEPPTGGG